MVGPDYHRPPVATPATWKELPGWTEAQPAAERPKGDWWTGFNDPLLDRTRAAGVGLEPDGAPGLRELSGGARRSAARAQRPVPDASASPDRRPAHVRRPAISAAAHWPARGREQLPAREQRRLARSQRQLGARPLGPRAPHHRGKRRHRAGEPGDARERDALRADRAGERGHRSARDAMRTSTCCTHTVDAFQQSSARRRRAGQGRHRAAVRSGNRADATGERRSRA